MANYIMLGKFTQQGLESITDSPKRRARAREVAESLGGSVKQAYLTMGQYDLVVVAEAPTDEAIAQIVLQVGMAGNISFQTLRAFDENETDKLLGSL